MTPCSSNPNVGICLYAQLDQDGKIIAMCGYPDGHDGEHRMMGPDGRWVEIPADDEWWDRQW